MSNNLHGHRSDRLREDAYCSQIDQQLMATLREAMQLQREVEACAANGHRETVSTRHEVRQHATTS
jgi:hypothetical protein